MTNVPSTNKKHFRTNTEKFTFRAASDSSPARVEGHAAVFNVMSPPLWELGGAREMILPGAFTRAIAEQDNVCLLVNHDPNLIVARSTAGTLTLKEDAVGLWFSATLPNTSCSLDLQENMRVGNLTACSFAFQIEDAAMEMIGGEPVQIIRSVGLSDVSIVAYPAYPQTDASLRSQYEGLIKSLTDINTSERRTAAMDCHARRKREIEILALDN